MNLLNFIEQFPDEESCKLNLCSKSNNLKFFQEISNSANDHIFFNRIGIWNRSDHKSLLSLNIFLSFPENFIGW